MKTLIVLKLNKNCQIKIAG